MARDPNRIDQLIQLLREYWHRCPDLRLGQIVCNLAEIPRDGQTKCDPYFVRDEVLSQRLARELVELDRVTDVPPVQVCELCRKQPKIEGNMKICIDCLRDVL